MNRPQCSTCFCFDTEHGVVSAQVIQGHGICRYSPVDQPQRSPNDSCSMHQDFEQWKLLKTSNISLDANTFDSFFTLITCLNGFLYACLEAEDTQSVFMVYQLYKVRLMDLKIKAEEKLIQ